MTAPPSIYSAQDVANRLRVSVDTVRNIARTYEIGFVVGGRRLFTDDDIANIRHRQPAPGAVPKNTPSQRVTQRAREREVRRGWSPERKRESLARLAGVDTEAKAVTRDAATRNRARWEPWEDEFIFTGIGKEIALQIGRTLDSVRSRRYHLRKQQRPSRTWG